MLAHYGLSRGDISVGVCGVPLIEEARCGGEKYNEGECYDSGSPGVPPPGFSYVISSIERENFRIKRRNLM